MKFDTLEDLWYTLRLIRQNVHGLYYASYGMTCACVEGSMITLVRECSLLHGS